MGLDNENRQVLKALRGYLQDLLETGVEGLPIVSEESVVFDHEKNDPVPSQAASVETPIAPAAESLKDIRIALENCSLCSLGSTKTKLVFGVGNPHARLVFVGEAPGRDEDLQGVPFVGRAGELLTSMIQRMGMERDDVYICNVLKCRPPNNRNPLPEEVEKCQPFLLRQLKAIGPDIIVALGTFAAQTLLGTKEPISKLRGRFHDYHGIPLMPTFHPSFLLRNGPEMRWVVWEDMVQVLAQMGLPVPDVKRKVKSEE